MLLNNLFYIDSISQEESGMNAEIHINVEHEILKGHFPDQPVVPGVCMLEMLKEILQQHLNMSLQLQSAPMVKFLAMFAPPHFTHAHFNIQVIQNEDNLFQVNATLQHEETIFMKFKGSFISKT